MMGTIIHLNIGGIGGGIYYEKYIPTFLLDKSISELFVIF